jgi:hypothetical protein
VLGRALHRLLECLPPEVARRLLDFRADREAQARAASEISDEIQF